MENILKIVEEISGELDSLRKFIYDNPEIGFEEYKSSRAHIDLLKKHGFHVECPYLGCETSFKAVYDSKKAGRTISYLSEYDALPGIGHGCGHNILGATATGAGIVLSKLIDELGGRVIVFGTAAEEVGGSKIELARSDELKDVDVAIEMHPGDINSVTPNSLALATRRFEFFGKTAHAADTPHEGINALDAQIVLFSAINALRQQTKDGSRIHGIIKDGGKAANIIPDYTDSRFYARSPEKKYLLELLEKLEACAKGAALATGCQVKISEYEKGNDNTVRNLAFNDLLKEKMEIYLDEEVKDIELNSGSTDAGDISHEVPTLHGYFKIAEEGTPSHTVDFRDATMTDYAFDQMKKTIAAIVEVGIEILQNDDVYKKITEEFKESVKSGKIIPHKN